MVPWRVSFGERRASLRQVLHRHRNYRPSLTVETMSQEITGVHSSLFCITRFVVDFLVGAPTSSSRWNASFNPVKAF